MFASVAISVLSLAMLLYWFRYTCVLLLQARHSHDFALAVIREHGLSFRSISTLSDDQGIERELRRDFQVLSALMGSVSGQYGFEVLVLRIDFAVMSTWWKLTRTRHPRTAHPALREMTAVLENWAALLGVEQAARA